MQLETDSPVLRYESLRTWIHDVPEKGILFYFAPPHPWEGGGGGVSQRSYKVELIFKLDLKIMESR